MKKKECNDERLALETRRLELKQEVKNKKIEAYKQVENRKLDIQEKELQLKQSMEDERVMNMDLSGLSERQKRFYMSLQDEIIARRERGGAS